MTKHLLQDLDRLSQDLLRISGKVEDAIADAIESILARDDETARKVIARDREIDQEEVEVEEKALKILALHQPVAGDLRFVVSAVKINNDLERIGDHAVNIAKRARELARLPAVVPPEGIEEMTGKVRSMVRQAIEALIHRDPGAARKVPQADDAVDDANHAIIRSVTGKIVQAASEDRDRIEPLMKWITVSRNLERVADLACNIAEDVIYLVEAEIVRHPQA